MRKVLVNTHARKYVKHANLGLFTKREQYLNFTVCLFTNRLIFFCLFHRLNYMKCNISEIFLPSRSGKFGENVPYRVKSDEHFVFIHKRFI